MTKKIIIRDGIIRRDGLVLKITKLSLDETGGVRRIEGRELCPDCESYLINQSACRYCVSCGYERC